MRQLKCKCGRDLDTSGPTCGVCVGIALGIFDPSIRRMVEANEKKKV